MCAARMAALVGPIRCRRLRNSGLCGKPEILLCRRLLDAGQGFSRGPAAKACWTREPALRGLNRVKNGKAKGLWPMRGWDPIQLWDPDNKRSAGTRKSSGSFLSASNQGVSRGIAWHKLAGCRKLYEDGHLAEAVDTLNLLVERGCQLDSYTLYQVLKKCIAKRDLGLGTRVHAVSVRSGYEGNAFLATHLIGLYASHRRLDAAMAVFSKVSTPNAYMWGSIILAYARHGQPVQAIGLYRIMLESTVRPDNHVFVAVLKACASARDLAAGRDVHAHILASVQKPDMFVENCLVFMYAKCGSLKDAQTVFDSLSRKTVVTWTSMIAGYVQQGMGQEALSLYSSMIQEDVCPPDSVTFLCLLQACASVGVAALHLGKQLHAHIRDQGVQDDVVLGSGLVNMYSKCGSIDDARKVFDTVPQKNVVTWTAMITGYAQQGMGQEALHLYARMQQEGLFPPDAITFVSLLQACATVGDLHHGKQLHAQIEERGLLADVVLGNSLVSMYAMCGNLEDAERVFCRLSQKDVVTWNAMMAGYAQQGMIQEATGLYSSMQQEGTCPPDSVTVASLLQAYAGVGLGALHHGKHLHAEIEGRGLDRDMVVGNSLVNMYVKCSSLDHARRVFDRLSQKDEVSWNTMIAGYTQQAMFQEALSLYSGMQQEGACAPNTVTFACLLQACACVGSAALHQGKQLHVQIEEQGLQRDVVVGNSLINMYAKCGSMQDAQDVFNRLLQKDVVTWNTVIAGYVHQGMAHKAFDLYSSMQKVVVPPNYVTFVSLLHACASVAALNLGKRLHAQIEEQGLQVHVAVGNSLVNMYAKCGSLGDAQQVFDSLPEKDVVAWGALIAGYARQGDGEVVFSLVQRMGEEGIQLDRISFLGLLTVCSNLGLVDKGRQYFEAMTRHYGITPAIEHYTCMLDLLSRAGHLDEALWMVRTMPCQPDGAAWLALLGGCRKWGNVEIGRQAFEFAVRLDPKDGAAYVLMSNIYAGAQMWEEAKEMHTRRVACGAWKSPGQSWWIGMDGVAHRFVVGDTQHHSAMHTWSRSRE